MLLEMAYNTTINHNGTDYVYFDWWLLHPDALSPGKLGAWVLRVLGVLGVDMNGCDYLPRILYPGRNYGGYTPTETLYLLGAQSESSVGILKDTFVSSGMAQYTRYAPNNGVTFIPDGGAALPTPGTHADTGDPAGFISWHPLSSGSTNWRTIATSDLNFNLTSFRVSWVWVFDGAWIESYDFLSHLDTYSYFSGPLGGLGILWQRIGTPFYRVPPLTSLDNNGWTPPTELRHNYYSGGTISEIQAEFYNAPAFYLPGINYTPTDAFGASRRGRALRTLAMFGLVPTMFARREEWEE